MQKIDSAKKSFEKALPLAGVPKNHTPWLVFGFPLGGCSVNSEMPWLVLSSTNHRKSQPPQSPIKILTRKWRVKVKHPPRRNKIT